VLHRAAYEALGLSRWRYDAVECGEDELRPFLAAAGPEWVGLSLTLPLKRAALTVASDVSPLAQSVGAANTLLLSDGRCRAENTDVTGIAAALRGAGVDRVPTAAVLGAGGTAQAALAALRELGCLDSVVIVRDITRTAEVRATAQRLGLRVDIRGGYPECTIPPVDVLVSSLPPGAADAARLDPITGPSVVLDVVYSPWPTVLAARAEQRGATAVGGHAVLLYQAIGQVELMTGRPPPVAAMRRALSEATGPRRPSARR
jgi:shikimate dehydrogenase